MIASSITPYYVYTERTGDTGQYKYDTNLNFEVWDDTNRTVIPWNVQTPKMRFNISCSKESESENLKEYLSHNYRVEYNVNGRKYNANLILSDYIEGDFDEGYIEISLVTQDYVPIVLFPGFNTSDDNDDRENFDVSFKIIDITNNYQQVGTESEFYLTRAVKNVEPYYEIEVEKFLPATIPTKPEGNIKAVTLNYGISVEDMEFVKRSARAVLTEGNDFAELIYSNITDTAATIFLQVAENTSNSRRNISFDVYLLLQNGFIYSKRSDSRLEFTSIQNSRQQDIDYLFLPGNRLDFNENGGMVHVTIMTEPNDLPLIFKGMSADYIDIPNYYYIANRDISTNKLEFDLYCEAGQYGFLDTITFRFQIPATTTIVSYYLEVFRSSQKQVTITTTGVDNYISVLADDNKIDVNIYDYNTKELIYNAKTYNILGNDTLNITNILENYTSARIPFIFLNDNGEWYDVYNNTDAVVECYVEQNDILTDNIYMLKNVNEDYNQLLPGVWQQEFIMNEVHPLQLFWLTKYVYSREHDTDRNTWATDIAWYFSEDIEGYEEDPSVLVEYDQILNCMPYNSRPNTTVVNLGLYNGDPDYDRLALLSEDLRKPLEPKYHVQKMFKVVCKDKYKYALYYLNKNYAPDYILLNGTSIESHNITRSIVNNKYDNTSIQHGKVNYLNEVRKKWSLNTNLLTDEQAKLMCNVFESTEVYLHDFETNKIYPVNVTDSSYNVKTFLNNKRKLFNYSLTVEESQSRNVIK